MLKRLLPWIGIIGMSSSFAALSPFGVGGSVLLIGQHPDNLHAFRANITFEPPAWAWKHWHIFFDASIGHWWVSNNTPHHSLNTYALAPVFRYYFKQRYFFTPFIDISIGPAYLSTSRFSNLNLGMHFAFQDMVGIGAAIGQNKNFYLSLSAMHYSNGALSSSNSGITAPLLLNMSYRF